jgi:hypothetical protein
MQLPGLNRYRYIGNNLDDRRGDRFCRSKEQVCPHGQADHRENSQGGITTAARLIVGTIIIG